MIVSLYYDCLFRLPLVFTILSFFHTYIDHEEKSYAWVMIGSLVTLFLLLTRYLKWKGRMLLGGILLTVMFAACSFQPSGEWQEIVKANNWIIWESLLAAACFFAGEAAGRFQKLKAVMAGGGCVTLIVLLFRGTHVSKISVCMIFLFTLLTLADELQRHTDKEGNTDPKKHLTAISPFILAIFILTMVIKVSENPYDWGFVKRIGMLIRSEYILLSENIFGENDWDQSTPVIGFSDRAGVGGNLVKKNRTVMEISSWSNNGQKVYLAGKYYDMFDGHNWSKEDENKADEGLLDSIETMSALLDRREDIPLSDLVKKRKLTVKYIDMHTKCLFTPAKSLLLNNAAAHRISEGGDYSFKNKRDSKKPYEIRYYQMNRTSKAFKKVAGDGHVMDEDCWERAKAECGVYEDIGYKAYESYHDNIYKYYLPKTHISSKLGEYVDQLLLGAKNDYEKLCRLEEMFHSFHYTIKPGDLPDYIKNEEDYLDYFIFKKQEGYCSYYATAFVLLSRAYDIPARYVQGYAVSLGKQIKTDVDSTWAHAWPEAYIDGIGWIAFEPTPGMKKETGWRVQSEKKEMQSDNSSSILFSPLPGVMEQDEVSDVETQQRISLHWYQVGLSLLMGMGFILLGFLVRRRIREVCYQKMSEREKAVFICKNSLMLLGQIHLERREAETLSEYEARIRAGFCGDEIAFIKVFEEILYSDKEISISERKELEKGYKLLKKYCYQVSGVAHKVIELLLY